MKPSKTFIFGLVLTATLLTTASYAQSSFASTATANDAGALATVAAIDKNEILLGVVATNKKTIAGVADLAHMMIQQHGDNLTQILEMAHRLKAFPLRGGDSKKLTLQGNEEMAMLGGLEGKTFDKAYTNAMVKGHEAALDLIDNHLMKMATSETVKKFLTETRAVVAEHLAHAKKLQKDMG